MESWYCIVDFAIVQIGVMQALHGGNTDLHLLPQVVVKFSVGAFYVQAECCS